MPEGPILLFDGVCHLCDHSVRFVLARDRRQIFRFAALQSAAGTRLMNQFAPDALNLKSVVLIADGVAHTKSDAVLQIAARLNGPWHLLRILRLVPRPLRDWAYDRVAGNRYRWFGRSETCLMPTAALRSRFLTG